jgi:hypothetical protein
MTDRHPENERAGLQPGADDAKQTDTGNSATTKPDIDLVSWQSLGANVKPARVDRRQKRGWSWKKGGSKL